MRAAVLVPTLLLLASGGAEAANDVKPRLDLEQGVIVHLFEWKWPDIAKECEDFLAPHGFKAVQISPPTENLVIPGRPWYERYQTVSYDFKTRSGDEKALGDMLKRCNKVGIRVIADVILNHMTGDTKQCVGTGGSKCNAEKRSYPHSTVEYEMKHFHKVCSIKNWKDVNQVRNCELVALHDLDQSQKHVQSKMVNMLNRLVGLGMAGFRIDAAKHMDPVDLKVIFDQLEDLNTSHGFPRNTKPFIFQEVIDTGNNENRDASQFEEYTHLGLVTDMRFSMEVGRLFRGQNALKHLHNVLTGWGLKPSENSVVCVENHDTEREGGYAMNSLNYKNSQRYKVAIAYMLALPHGTPQILSSFKFNGHSDPPPVEPGTENLMSPFPLVDGFCRDGWMCQHRWRQIYGMVEFHNVVKGAEFHKFVSFGDYQIAFCRGNKGFIAINLDKNRPLNERVQTCLPKGEYCDVISGYMENGQCMGKKVTVEDGGQAMIRIEPFTEGYSKENEQDGVLAIHAQSNVLYKKPPAQSPNYLCAKFEEWKKSNFPLKSVINKLEELNCKSRS